MLPPEKTRYTFYRFQDNIRVFDDVGHPAFVLGVILIFSFNI